MLFHSDAHLARDRDLLSTRRSDYVEEKDFRELRSPNALDDAVRLQRSATYANESYFSWAYAPDWKGI